MNKLMLAMMMAVLGGFNGIYASDGSESVATTTNDGSGTIPPIVEPQGWQKALPSTASAKAQANRNELWEKKDYNPQPLPGKK